MRVCLYVLLTVGAVLLAACGNPTTGNEAASSETPAKSPAKFAESSSAELVRYTEEREPCDSRNPLRNAYFGDLHIHTAYSYDVRPMGTRTTPADAYRYAQGEEIQLAPYDEFDRPFTIQKIDRPLDFAAVTDHSEYLGEMTLCEDPDGEAYHSPTCKTFRDGGVGGVLVFVRGLSKQPRPERDLDVCGSDGAKCVNASGLLWQRTREMAEAAYDRSPSCRFTSFIAYEHTGTPNGNNYHRNVIFRNAQVPERPASYIDSPSDYELWDRLTADCLQDIAGCDVLAIPHNANLSSGSMFPSYLPGSESMVTTQARAETRNALEPVMEIFQHKGNSECFNGLPDILGEPDELCEIELLHKRNPQDIQSGKKSGRRFCEPGETGRGGMMAAGCISSNDYFRSILLTGMQTQTMIGVNPYQFGAIASTDTHVSTPGAVSEGSWSGHVVAEASLAERLTPSKNLPVGLQANPGGLAGIWAVENSRDALFEAIQRREVFGTTGPRMLPRLFGGWDYTDSICSSPDPIGIADAGGVPMGANLPARTSNSRPRFVALATRDPESSPLQRLQIIKGWIDTDATAHYKVFDVAGDDPSQGTVDLATGAWNGPGHNMLCAVFEDPDFDADQLSYYYLRAAEVPSLRWSWRQCAALPAGDRPEECANDAPKVIQELAWTSPIWYSPQAQ